jgi:hypothetical protein
MYKGWQNEHEQYQTADVKTVLAFHKKIILMMCFFRNRIGKGRALN